MRLTPLAVEKTVRKKWRAKDFGLVQEVKKKPLNAAPYLARARGDVLKQDNEF